MQRVVLDGVEPGSVVRAVDARTYARGVLFAQRRAVAEMEWDGEHNALYTEVHDSGTVHEAVAYFRVRRARLDFVFGECTCPAGMNCVHVVASVLAAADTAGVGRTGTAGAHPPWERTLRSLFAPDPPSLNDLREPVPLAVELSLSAGHGRSVALSARVVRPGRTGWVGGGMSWRNVASHYSLGDCAPAHVRVLRELYALHSAGSGPSRYHYGGSDRTIDLAGVGRGLWSVLDEAADVGLQIVHARKRFGTVDRYGSAELCLDVTAGTAAEALEIAPALRLDAAEETDADALPILFLGAEGHGVVHVSRAQCRVDSDPAHWRFRLARLATPAPPPLRRLVLEGGISGAGGPADALPRRVLPPAEPARAGGVVGHVVHPAGRRPARAGAPCRLRRRARAHRAVGMGLRGGRNAGPLPARVLGRATRPSATPRTSGPRWTRSTCPRSRPGCCGRTDPVLPCCRRSGSTGSTPCGCSTEVLPLLADTDGVVVEVDGAPAVYRETGDLAADRRLHRRVGRGHRLVRPGHPDQRRGPRRSRSPTSSSPWPPASRTCCCRTGRTSRCRSPSCRRCARSSRRPGRCRTRRRARCGSAASRPACGTSWPRSASSTPRRAPGSSRSTGLLADGRAAQRRRSPPVCAHSCVPTSATVSTGCASCGGTGSAACSPTTWGWARRCRRWP